MAYEHLEPWEKVWHQQRELRLHDSFTAFIDEGEEPGETSDWLVEVLRQQGVSGSTLAEASGMIRNLEEFNLYEFLRKSGVQEDVVAKVATALGGQNLDPNLDPEPGAQPTPTMEPTQDPQQPPPTQEQDMAEYRPDNPLDFGAAFKEGIQAVIDILPLTTAAQEEWGKKLQDIRLETEKDGADFYANMMLGLQQEYGDQFIDEALQQLEQADPQGFAARDALYNEVMGDVGGTSESYGGAKMLQHSIMQDLAAGGRLDPQTRREVIQGTRGAQAARGNVLGDANAFAEAMEIGDAAYQRRSAAQQRMQDFLVSGAAPEDIGYEHDQRVKENLGGFLEGRSPLDDFSKLGDANKGAAPVLIPEVPGVVDPAIGATSARYDLSQWQTAAQTRMRPSSIPGLPGSAWAWTGGMPPVAGSRSLVWMSSGNGAGITWVDGRRRTTRWQTQEDKTMGMKAADFRALSGAIARIGESRLRQKYERQERERRAKEEQRRDRGEAREDQRLEMRRLDTLEGYRARERTADYRSGQMERELLRDQQRGEETLLRREQELEREVFQAKAELLAREREQQRIVQVKETRDDGAVGTYEQPLDEFRQGSTQASAADEPSAKQYLAQVQLDREQAKYREHQAEIEAGDDRYFFDILSRQKKVVKLEPEIQKKRTALETIIKEAKEAKEAELILLQAQKAPAGSLLRLLSQAKNGDEIRQLIKERQGQLDDTDIRAATIYIKARKIAEKLSMGDAFAALELLKL